MPLLVVTIAAEEAGSLTLDEWDALAGRDQVLFERSDHPLIPRLRSSGATADPFDDELSADDDRRALVAEPGSERVVALAREGAEVLGGARDVPDSLTAAHGSKIARRAASQTALLAAVMARLRSEDGCPWDREQDHQSLKPHLLEESYEVIDAIERDASTEELTEELGDLLLQVVFHAQLGLDDGHFDLGDVAAAITAKLLHRHPHVFSDVVVSGAGEVVANWEKIKAAEKKRAGPFDGIPRSLPALVAAHKTQKRAAALGFAADAADAAGRVRSALDDGDVGSALFWTVALARATGVDAEGALRAALARFRGSLAGEGSE